MDDRPWSWLLLRGKMDDGVLGHNALAMDGHIVHLFKRMAVFVAYGHIHGEVLSGGPLESSLHRAAVVEVAAHGQLHMVVGHPYIVGGIDAGPAVLRQPGFHPGMGGAFSA